MVFTFDKEIQITPKNNPESVIESTVVNVCDKMNIGEEQLGNILVALTEAVDNAIEHGNKKNPDKVVQLAYQSSEQKITFAVTDQGQGFDYSAVTDPTKPENPENKGRGIFLMKLLADKTEFLNEGKTVILSFNLN